MVRRKLLALTLLAVLSVWLMPPGTAKADNDDFTVEYEFSPNPTGYLGGMIQLRLTVRNTGATDITWVDVSVFTGAGFSKRWNGRIPPGDRRTLAYNVPFSETDVNFDRLLRVYINNDGDASPDGIQQFGFRIAVTADIFGVSTSLTPNRSFYFPNNTIEISFTFTNRFETHAATGVMVSAGLSDEDNRFFAVFPRVSKGTVMPGAGTVYTCNYTFTEDDIGKVYIHYVLEFRIVGADYYMTTWTKQIDVIEPLPARTLSPGGTSEPDVSFTASLSADKTEINAGDTVDFRITVRNTGEDDIGGFEITNMGGAKEANAEGMAAGADGSIIIRKQIYDTCNMRFVVIGRPGGLSVSKETNSVRITVREEVAPTPETAAPPATTEGTPPLPSEAAPSLPIASPSASAATTSVVSMPSGSEAPAQAQTQLITGIPNEVLLAMIAILLLAVAVLLTVLLLKRKS